MKRATLAYIRAIDAMNYRIGRVAMYLLFVLIGVLLWSIFMRAMSYSFEGFIPAGWTIEIAKFLLVAYFIVGGPYSMQLGANVRMDLFYGGWSPKQKAWMDAITVLFLAFYLGVVLNGAAASLAYALGAHYKLGAWEFFGLLISGFFTGGFEGAAEHLGRFEATRTWKLPLWPIKLTIALGVILMLLQASSEFLKDLLRIRGEEI